jgi:hypothetical protein
LLWFSWWEGLLCTRGIRKEEWVVEVKKKKGGDKKKKKIPKISPTACANGSCLFIFLFFNKSVDANKRLSTSTLKVNANNGY